MVTELQAPHEQSTEALNIQFCTHCLQFHRLQRIESYKCFPGEEAHHLPHGFCHTLHGFTDLACTTKFATEDFVIWCLVQIRSFAIMFTAPRGENLADRGHGDVREHRGIARWCLQAWAWARRQPPAPPRPAVAAGSLQTCG